jgi:hypothetical protein
MADKDPLGILKKDNNDPLGILKKKEQTQESTSRDFSALSTQLGKRMENAGETIQSTKTQDELQARRTKEREGLLNLAKEDPTKFESEDAFTGVVKTLRERGYGFGESTKLAEELRDTSKSEILNKSSRRATQFLSGVSNYGQDASFEQVANASEDELEEWAGQLREEGVSQDGINSAIAKIKNDYITSKASKREEEFNDKLLFDAEEKERLTGVKTTAKSIAEDKAALLTAKTQEYLPEEYKIQAAANKKYETLLAEMKEEGLKEGKLTPEIKEKYRAKLIALEKLRQENGTVKKLYNPVTGEFGGREAEEYENTVLSFGKQLTDKEKTEENLEKALHRFEAIDELYNQEIAYTDANGDTKYISTKDALALKPITEYALDDEVRRIREKGKGMQSNWIRTKAQFDAVNRAFSTNTDPSQIEKGFFESAGEGLMSALDQEERTVTSQAQEGSDRKFVNEYVSLMNDLGAYSTPEQKEAAERTLRENVGEAVGTSLPIMADIMMSTALVETGAGAVKLAKYMKPLKDLFTNKFGKIGKFFYGVVEEGVKGGVSFAPTDESFAGGFGEGVTQGIIDNMMGKRGKTMNRFLKYGYKTLGGTTGETIQEFGGQYLDELSKQGIDANTAFKNVFGRDIEDATDKLLTTLIVSGMFSGAFNGKVLLETRAQLEADYNDGNIPEEKRQEVKEILDKTKKQVPLAEKAVRKESEQLSLQFPEETEEEVVAEVEPTPTDSDIREEVKPTIEPTTEEEIVEESTIKEPIRLKEPTKPIKDDSENGARVSGEVEEGKEPIATKPDKRTSPKKTKASGSVQKKRPSKKADKQEAIGDVESDKGKGKPKVETTTKEQTIFKGLGGKKDAKGKKKTAHPNVKGVFASFDEGVAKDYERGEGVSQAKLPKGTTIETIEIDGKGMTLSAYRKAETDAINNSDAQVVKLITKDGKVGKKGGKQEQLIIKDEALLPKTEQEVKPKINPKYEVGKTISAKGTVGAAKTKGKIESSEEMEGNPNKAILTLDNGEKVILNKKTNRVAWAKGLNKKIPTKAKVNVGGEDVSISEGMDIGYSEIKGGEPKRKKIKELIFKDGELTGVRIPAKGGSIVIAPESITEVLKTVESERARAAELKAEEEAKAKIKAEEDARIKAEKEEEAKKKEKKRRESTDPKVLEIEDALDKVDEELKKLDESLKGEGKISVKAYSDAKAKLEKEKKLLEKNKKEAEAKTEEKPKAKAPTKKKKPTKSKKSATTQKTVDKAEQAAREEFGDEFVDEIDFNDFDETSDPFEDYYQKSTRKERATVKYIEDVVANIKRAFPNIKVVYDSSIDGLGMVNDFGEIVINPDKASVDTPFHEFSEVWLKLLKTKNPQAYTSAIEAVKKDTDTMYFVKMTRPDLTTEQSIAEEALNMLIGEKSSEKFDKLKSNGKIKTLFKDLWDVIKRVFGIKRNISWDKVSELTLKEFLSIASAEILSTTPLSTLTSSDLSRLMEGGTLTKVTIDSNVISPKARGIRDKAIDLFKGTFRSQGLLPKWVANLDSNTRSAVAGIISEASKHVQLLDKTVSSYVKDNKLTKEQAEELLLNINEGLAGRLSEEALTKYIPTDIALLVDNMRNNIDEMSKELAESGYIKGDIVATINDSIGTYIRRSYEIHKSRPRTVKSWLSKLPEGVETRARLWLEAEVKKGITKYIKFRKLPNGNYMITSTSEYGVESDSIEITPNQLSKTLKDSGTDTEILDKNKGNITLEKPIKIDGVKLKYSDLEYIVTEQINDIIATHLSKEGNFVASGLNKKDTSILKKRKEIDEEIRDLLGEIKDPSANYLETVSKMASYLEYSKFLNRLKDEGMNKVIWKEKPKGLDTVKISSDGNERWKPLDGYYTTTEFKEALEHFERDGMLSINSNTLQYINTFAMYLNTFTKSAMTKWNIPSNVRNHFGAVMMAWRLGYTNPGEMKEAYADFWSGMRTETKKPDAFKEEWNEMRRLGLIDDAVGYNTYKESMDRAVANSDNVRGAIAKLKKNSAVQILNTPREVMDKLYLAPDAAAKMFLFRSMKKDYRKAYPNLSDAQLNEKVANIIKDVMPTYSKMSKGAKALSRNPLVGAFASFTTEMVRNVANQGALIKSEWIEANETNNKELKKLAVKKLIGLSSMMMLVPFLSALSRALLVGIDKDEDDDIASLVPEWEENSWKIKFSKGFGSIATIDLSYTDPLAVFNKPYYALLNGILSNDKTIVDGVGDAFTEARNQFFGQEPLARALAEAYNNEDGYGRPISKPLADEDYKRIFHALDILKPKFVNTIQDFITIGKGNEEETEFGKKYDFTTYMISTFAGTRYKKDNLITAASFKIGREVYQEDGVNDAKNLYRNSETKSQKDLDKANKKLKKIFDEHLKNIRGAKAVGATDYQIKKALNKRRMVDGKEIGARYIPEYWVEQLLNKQFEPLKHDSEKKKTRVYKAKKSSNFL